MPLKISRQSNSSEILQAALAKRIKHDCSFRKDKSYALAYPDGSIVNTLPGTNESFTLEKYKEDSGKIYSRITLYLLDQSQEKPQPDECEFNSLSPSEIEHSGEIEPATASTSGQSSFTKFTESMMRCPLCNKKFSINEIEIHADRCARKREDPFACYDVPSDSNESSSCDFWENEPKQHEDKMTIITKIKQSILKVSFDDTPDESTIHIRRKYSFEDFYQYFQKPWNRKKVNQKFKISFVGGSGIDTGGVKRDFFSGNYQYSGILYRQLST